MSRVISQDHLPQACFAVLAFVSLCMFTTPSLAHEGTGVAGGFTSGLLHPISGPDHVAAMVAVGL
jgi:urease accessory protein